VQSWQAVAGPKGLPPEVKAKLNAAIVAALNDPSVKDKLLAQGFEIVGDSPEHFAKFQATEFHRWKKLIETRHISAD
jgi:tripartite-type tricarboxylate transporter receptor subunit TctC